MNKQTAYKKVL